jgi:branched-chain amino acid transport system permease protein
LPSFLTKRKINTDLQDSSSGPIQEEMIPFQLLLQSIVSGLLMGGIYALVAVGLSLIFGLMNIVNFAHGDYLMLAMYATFWAFQLLKWDPLVTLPLVMVVWFFAGAGTYRVFIRRILDAPMVAQMFCTFGLGLFLRYAAYFFWSADVRKVGDNALSGILDLGNIFVTKAELAAFFGSLAATLLLFLFIKKTRIGKAIQATSQNREAAIEMGIYTDRVNAIGWGLGIMCVGIGGVLLATFYPIHIYSGWMFSLISYIAVALGGFGSFWGVYLGGLIIGLIENVFGTVFVPTFKMVFVYAAFVFVLIYKPKGLFGKF